MSNWEIEKTVSIDVPANIVFEVLTDPEKIGQYYPLKKVVIDRKVGGEIICQGVNEGKQFTDYGRIEIFEPNRQFQYSYWSDNHQTENIPENYLTICYTLEARENSTNVQLRHSNLPSQAMYLSMLDVWDFLLDSLKNYCEENFSVGKF